MTNDLDDLTKRVRDFGEARDWRRYHAPKNLAMALSVEASELLEIFQWMTAEESDNLDDRELARSRDEIADVQIYLLQIADRLGISIGDAVQKKMMKNAEKYPAA